MRILKMSHLYITSLKIIISMMFAALPFNITDYGHNPFHKTTVFLESCDKENYYFFQNMELDFNKKQMSQEDIENHIKNSRKMSFIERIKCVDLMKYTGTKKENMIYVVSKKDFNCISYNDYYVVTIRGVSQSCLSKETLERVYCKDIFKC